MNHTSHDGVDSRLGIDAGVAVGANPGSTGRKKSFDLTITWEDYNPDGFTRKMMLVNGQSPGPLLEIDQGDWVVVTVHNQSPFNTTIHYHGGF